MKYNFILRGAFDDYTNDFIRFYIQNKCCGNSYPTTLLYLCLGINKLSLITKAQLVYRAPGGILPKHFYEADEAGSRGGVALHPCIRTTPPRFLRLMHLQWVTPTMAGRVGFHEHDHR